MMSPRIIGLTVLVLALPCLSAFADPPIEFTLIESTRIWANSPCDAFTDMVRYNDKFYVTFREGTGHGVYGDGHARVIRSSGGSGNISAWSWESVAYLDYENPTHSIRPGENWDVRDPKLTVAPDGRLMLNAAAAPLAYDNERQSIAWFSEDGTDWTTDGPHDIGEYSWWMWRVAWHPDGTLYGGGYGDTRTTNPPCRTRLYRSEYHPENVNPLDFQVHVPTLLSNSTEMALLFRKGGNHTAVALVRDYGSEYRSWVGTAEGDYTDWTFHELGKELGGPALLELPDGSIVAGTRYPSTRTSLCWLDPEGGELVQLLQLPSGGDTGYPGLVWHDGYLWVSYYSGSGGDEDIYLAKVAVTFVPEPSTSVMMLLVGLGGVGFLARRARATRSGNRG